MPRLTEAQIRQILEQLKTRVDKDSCWTCSCLQGFITQLELDADPAAHHLLTPYKVSRDDMHACLGCDPCVPGELHANMIWLMLENEPEQ